MPWFAKIEAGIVDKATFDKYVPAHKAYVQDPIAKGHKARSGYRCAMHIAWKRRGGGMLLFDAASRDEAEAIVSEDLLIKNGCVKYELYEWCLIAE